jgi:CHAT domain-containing protein
MKAEIMKSGKNRAGRIDRSILKLLLVLLALFCAGNRAKADGSALAEQAQRAFQRGAFGEAAAHWEKAVKAFHEKSDTDAEIKTSIDLASAWQFSGRQRRAVQLLENTLALAEKLDDSPRVILVKSKLGAALIMTREFDRARDLLGEALKTGRANRDSKLTAAILNDLGNLLMSQQAYPEALAAYDECVVLAHQSSNSWLTAQALCNAAATAARAGNNEKADELNSLGIREMASLESSHAKAFFLLTAGQTDLQIRFNDPDAAKRVQLRAHESFRQALQLAEKENDRPIQTYALGYMGRMYELDRQPEAALDMTRRAAFVAQEAQMPEALYRWEGQIAQLLKAQGNADSAIAAFRRAIQTLQSIRNDVSMGLGNAVTYQSFREVEGPLYLGLADLLLDKAGTARGADAEQALLAEARDTMEQLKTFELESYFCDDCVDVHRSKIRAVEAVDKRTAVIYLISLPTRTEVLVGLASGLKRFSAPVAAEALTTEVRQFRRNLETRTSYGYLAQAQTLYDWLIRPIRPFLGEHGIDTLVIVPDGAMRTIPFATLHDGKNFLIQEFAVAVAPGLSMISPKPLERANVRMLLNGLSESVQGFAPLTFVTGELQSIEGAYSSEKLLNENFTLSSLKQKLSDEQYSIVHIASHGQFDRDVRKTFVLTHDTKLTLNDLEALIRPSQYRGRPVEMLVLSACQTAAGDDRAALGLAGIAVKAGARSALATLWFVNDQSTSALITEVYQQLRQSPRLSRAKALQAAQLQLLKDRRYRHPCYWSPYLLIGNWL